jgi:alpha-glucan,water dikinase
MSNDRHGLYLIYIWLRYSALRQLDWQRNYNTQPRELSHALDRLCLKLSSIYAENSAVRHIIPMILSNIGPGGDGQRIRDEILNIMHRNKLKEVNHTFVEQWHQKLHNNATADDIVICSAYIEFLRSYGKLDVFYSTLNSMGVTRERLTGFERPIRSDPEFIPHLRDALIRDFEHYLKILNSVHKGVDLERACDSVTYIFGGDVMGALRFIVDNRDSMDITVVTRLFTTITWIRQRIREVMVSERTLGRLKDLLFLDLSLMEYLRVLTERNLHANLGGHTLMQLIDLSLENLLLTDLPPVEKAHLYPDIRAEIQSCINHIRKINTAEGTEWVLSSLAVVERIERFLGLFVDFYYSAFQSSAEHLGNRFNAAPWTVTMFTEEVLRGQFHFVVSLLLRYLNRLLRTEAGLRRWQVLSPFEASGVVELYHSLKEIEGREFKVQTVIITEKVSGDEDIPAGVTAVISEEMADIVSHVSVRARNERILFATCFSDEILSHLKSLKGRYVSLGINPQGDVVVTELDQPVGSLDVKKESVGVSHKIKQRVLTTEDVPHVIGSLDFNKDLVGGKSLNLAKLKNKLPGWINLPASAAIPFGVFDKVLKHPANDKNREKYDSLLRDLDANGNDTGRGKVSAVLSDIRQTVMSLTFPDDFFVSVSGVLQSSGLYNETNGLDTELFGKCIKQVWASVWNDRAYFNRKKMGLTGAMEMAVLIQRVIEADYAFVIHTVNPVTRDAEEMFAEVVPGLGETIVGNYPGRALSFTCKKSIGVPLVASYPGKSVGLYGGGFIFRSDSNAEDLENYAGAGLYDSVISPQPRAVALDYSTEPLLWDENFRNDTLLSIADIGKAVETALGGPQDIEGVYSGGRFYIVQSRPQVGI